MGQVSHCQPLCLSFLFSSSMYSHHSIYTHLHQSLLFFSSTCNFAVVFLCFNITFSSLNNVITATSTPLSINELVSYGFSSGPAMPHLLAVHSSGLWGTLSRGALQTTAGCLRCWRPWCRGFWTWSTTTTTSDTSSTALHTWVWRQRDAHLSVCLKCTCFYEHSCFCVTI